MIIFKKSTRIVSALIAVFFAFFSYSSPVGALDKGLESFYSNNNVRLFDETAPDCTTVGSVSLSGKDRIEQALNFYMQHRLTLAQAAGIVGNYMAESGVDPRKEEGGRIVDDNYKPIDGVGFGIAQWTFTSRQEPLVQYMKDNKVGITDLGGQLGFSWQELQTTHKEAHDELKRTSDPLNAAFVFHKYYEGSADTIEQIRNNRGGNAQKLFDQYKNSPPLATADSSPTSNACTSAASGNLAQTTFDYAWPDYKGNTIDATPAWTAAWQKARAAGFYVGGIDHPGIDCGGFVTRLLIDSGFEPNYNYGGKGGATTEQERWLRENWQPVFPDGKIDAGKLQAGDVAIKSSLTGQVGHTFIYVGKIPKFNSEIASASLDERAPMADPVQDPTDSNFTWYRKK